MVFTQLELFFVSASVPFRDCMRGCERFPDVRPSLEYTLKVNIKKRVPKYFTSALSDIVSGGARQ